MPSFTNINPVNNPLVDSVFSATFKFTKKSLPFENYFIITEDENNIIAENGDFIITDTYQQ